VGAAALDAQVGEVIVEESVNGEVISPRLAQVLVELVINQIAVIDALPNQHQLKNQVIYDLLHGLIDDEATVLRYSKLLGIDLSPPRAVILIDAADHILVSDSSQHRGVCLVPKRYLLCEQETVETRVRRRAQLITALLAFPFPRYDLLISVMVSSCPQGERYKNLATWANCGMCWGSPVLPGRILRR